MNVEIEPHVFRKDLRSAGLDETQIREIESEFSRNDYEMTDEALLGKLLSFRMDMLGVIALFGRLGIGEGTVMRMLEKRERDKLGMYADVYTLEVDCG
jgi:hypothetical protein